MIETNAQLLTELKSWMRAFDWRAFRANGRPKPEFYTERLAGLPVTEDQVPPLGRYVAQHSGFTILYDDKMPAWLRNDVPPGEELYTEGAANYPHKEIWLRASATPQVKVSTLVHEFAHTKQGHLPQTIDPFDAMFGITETAAEAHAELVNFLVLARLDKPTALAYSGLYLRHQNAPGDVLDEQFPYAEPIAQAILDAGVIVPVPAIAVAA